MPAAENDEVISRDDMRPERFTTFGQPPVLQEPVHVDVGKRRACNPALIRAAPCRNLIDADRCVSGLEG